MKLFIPHLPSFPLPPQPLLLLLPSPSAGTELPQTLGALEALSSIPTGLWPGLLARAGAGAGTGHSVANSALSRAWGAQGAPFYFLLLESSKAGWRHCSDGAAQGWRAGAGGAALLLARVPWLQRLRQTRSCCACTIWALFLIFLPYCISSTSCTSPMGLSQAPCTPCAARGSPGGAGFWFINVL